MRKLVTIMVLVSIMCSLVGCDIAKTIKAKKISGTWTITDIKTSDDSSEGLINKLKVTGIKLMFKKDSEVNFRDTQIDLSATQASVEYKIEDNKIYLKDTNSNEYNTYLEYEINGDKMTMKFLTLTIELTKK